MKINSVVTAIYLGANGIGDAGAKAAVVLSSFLADTLPFECHLPFLQALTEMLKVNTTLKILSLYQNQIGDSGVEAQVLLFWRHSSNFHPIHNWFAQALAEALQHNRTLTYLDLGDNDIEDEGVEASVLLALKALSQFPLHMLLPTGFGRCTAAQPEPHRAQPPWQWLWPCQSPGPVRRCVARSVRSGRCLWRRSVWRHGGGSKNTSRRTEKLRLRSGVVAIAVLSC